MPAEALPEKPVPLEVAELPKEDDAPPGMADDGRGDSSAYRKPGAADAGPLKVLSFLEGDRDLSGLGAGDTELLVRALSPEEADAALEALRPGGEIAYQQWYHMPDAKKWDQPLKRLQRTKIAMADPEEEGLPWYRFPVNDQKRYGVVPMSPTVRKLRAMVEKQLGFRFNHAVVLFYADGDECIGYHKDKTLDLDENAPIVSISLGRPGRPYVLRDDIFKPTLENEILLPHGAVLALGPRTNQSFYHAVRQTPHPGDAGPRVSVTFRAVKTFVAASGELVGQGAQYQTLNWPVELGGAHRLDYDLDQPGSGPAPPAVKKGPTPSATASRAALKKANDRAAAVAAAARREDAEGRAAVLRAVRSANLATFLVAGDLRGARLAIVRALTAEVGEDAAGKLTKVVGRVLADEFSAWRKEFGGNRRDASVDGPLADDTAKCLPVQLDDSPANPRSPPGPSELLRFWFGEAPFAWRGGLWWRGIYPAEPGCATPAGTDERIRKDYGDLIRSCAAGVEGSQVESWRNTMEGRCALVLLLDQFPRNAFRATKEMFAYDRWAQQAATEALRHQDSLPWPHRLFCYVALMHTEDAAVVEEVAVDLLRFALELEEEQGTRIKAMHREAKEHASVLSRFGRYPHRNTLLGRESTADELEWLHAKRLPGWAKSVRAAAQPDSKDVPAKSANKAATKPPPAQIKPPTRILVLHSNRQNRTEFEKKTRVAFEPLQKLAQLFFAEAPHPYVPQGEAEHQVKAAGVTGMAVRNRCWWNATDDPKTMRYVGLEESVAYIEAVFEKHGPFDGVLGFSQGGCLAGLLAAMQPKGHIKFSFCVVISGFYCRDVEQCLLQLEEVPQEHSPAIVRPRRAAVQMPSFHTWGLQDQLVECWRSQLLADVFQDPIIVPHDSEHFNQARQHWPVRQLAEWLQSSVLPQLPPRPAAELVDTVVEPDTEVVQAWQRLGAERADDQPQLSADALTAAIEACGGLDALVLRACSAMTEGAEAAETARRVFTVTVSQASDTDWQKDQVLSMQEQAGWDSLVEVDMLAAQPEQLAAATPHLQELRDTITGIFARQLFDDSKAAASWLQLAPAADLSSPTKFVEFRLSGQAAKLPRPSDCARWAPRFGGAVQRKTQLALRVASQVHELKTGECIENPRQQQPRLDREYREMLREILKVMDAYSDARLANAMGQRKQEWHIHGMSEALFEKLKATPVSDAVLNPTPEPLDYSTNEEITPLFSFLQSGAKLQPNTKALDQVFVRGTLTPDRRLDLCKQVIGPDGVTGLICALASSSREVVQHLLLGNNMCGDELPGKIAELISSGKSHLTTWYIAGNCISAEGLAPLCAVLQNDTQVRQLWLKRNPLKPAVSAYLAPMLRANQTLQVLDLVNCGLLDQGAETLAPALSGSRLQHLYLDGNGLTATGARAIATSGHNLYTLSFGMNRLQDEGAQAVAENVGGVVRLSLAACGISPRGAPPLAAMLRSSRTLRFLDLGLPKATQALGEIPNRLSDQGVSVLAEALAENTALNALLLVHNSIHQSGFAALAEALKRNRTLVRLELEQLGIPFNELTREVIRLSLSRNQRYIDGLGDEERQRVAEALDPAHLEEIKSVYRVGNTYDGDILPGNSPHPAEAA